MPELFLLFENGDYIELEDNSGRILLENQRNESNIPDVLNDFVAGFGYTTVSTYGFF